MEDLSRLEALRAANAQWRNMRFSIDHFRDVYADTPLCAHKEQIAQLSLDVQEQKLSGTEFWNKVREVAGHEETENFRESLLMDLEAFLDHARPSENTGVVGRKTKANSARNSIWPGTLEPLLKARGLVYNEEMWYNPAISSPPCPTCYPATWAHSVYVYCLCSCEKIANQS